MATLTIAIDARQAEEGAKQVERALQGVGSAAQQAKTGLDGVQRSIDQQASKDSFADIRASFKQAGLEIEQLKSKTIAFGDSGGTATGKVSDGMKHLHSMGIGLETLFGRLANMSGTLAATFLGGDIISRIATGRGLIANVTDGLEKLGNAVREQASEWGLFGDVLDNQFGKGADKAVKTVKDLREELEKFVLERELAGTAKFSLGLGGVFGRDEDLLNIKGINLQSTQSAQQLVTIFRTLDEELDKIREKSRDTSLGATSGGLGLTLRQEQLAAIEKAQSALDKIAESDKKRAKDVEERAKAQAKLTKEIEASAAAALKFNKAFEEKKLDRLSDLRIGQSATGLATELAKVGVQIGNFMRETDRAKEAAAEFDKRLEAGAAINRRERAVRGLTAALLPLVNATKAMAAAEAEFQRQANSPEVLRFFAEEQERINGEQNAFWQSELDRQRATQDELEKTKHAWEGVGYAAGSALEDAAFKAGETRDIIRALGEDLARIAFRTLVTENLANVIGGAFGSAKGNVFDQGNVVPFAGGGVVTGPTFFPMSGGKTGLMGEAGPEAVVPLKRGSDGKLGIQGGGNTTVNLHVYGVTDADSFKRSQRQIEASLTSSLGRRL